MNTAQTLPITASFKFQKDQSIRKGWNLTRRQLKARARLHRIIRVRIMQSLTMAIILCKPGTLHRARPAIQAAKPTRKAPRPVSIGEAYEKAVSMGRPPQSKAAQS